MKKEKKDDSLKFVLLLKYGSPIFVSLMIILSLFFIEDILLKLASIVLLSLFLIGSIYVLKKYEKDQKENKN